MECLHAAVENFRRAGILSYVSNFESLLPQGLRGAACRENFISEICQGLRKLKNARLIRNADKRSFHNPPRLMMGLEFARFAEGFTENAVEPIIL
jgi:hypothetical protein